jgi:hypothetical protein
MIQMPQARRTVENRSSEGGGGYMVVASPFGNFRLARFFTAFWGPTVHGCLCGHMVSMAWNGFQALQTLQSCMDSNVQCG